MDYGVMKIYRISRKCYLKRIPIIPKVLKNFIRVFFGCTLPYKSDIGEETKLPHFGQGVVINDQTVIGKNCIISAGVVIGGKQNMGGEKPL